MLTSRIDRSSSSPKLILISSFLSYSKHLIMGFSNPNGGKGATKEFYYRWVRVTDGPFI